MITLYMNSFNFSWNPPKRLCVSSSNQKKTCQLQATATVFFGYQKHGPQLVGWISCWCGWGVGIFRVVGFRAHTAADGLIFPLEEGMGRSPFGKHNFQRDGWNVCPFWKFFFFKRAFLPAGKTEKYAWCGTPGFEGFFVPDHCASNVSSCNSAAKNGHVFLLYLYSLY